MYHLGSMGDSMFFEIVQGTAVYVRIVMGVFKADASPGGSKLIAVIASMSPW